MQIWIVSILEVINDISSRRDIFQTVWPTLTPKNPEYAASILFAVGEAHVAGSLFRSSKAGVVAETAPVDDEPAQPPVPEDEPELDGLLMDEEEPDPLTPAPTSRHRRRASARVRTASSCFGAPQLLGAGAVHRALESVRQGLFLNSVHHTMSRRCSTFQLFACHHKHVSTFSMPPKSRVERMLRASSETASGARDLRVEREIFPDICISCFVVFVFDISLADRRSLLLMCVLCVPELVYVHVPVHVHVYVNVHVYVFGQSLIPTPTPTHQHP